MGRIARLIRRHYVPFLLKPVVKGLVALFFAGVFVLSVISIQHIELGLGKPLEIEKNPILTFKSRPEIGVTVRVLFGRLLQQPGDLSGHRSSSILRVYGRERHRSHWPAAPLRAIHDL